MLQHVDQAPKNAGRLRSRTAQDGLEGLAKALSRRTSVEPDGVVGLDPEKYTGYAWGLGVERMVALRSGIRDIRLFAENDMRFLSQFYAV